MVHRRSQRRYNMHLFTDHPTDPAAHVPEGIQHRQVKRLADVTLPV